MTKEELATILNGKQYGTIPTRKEVSLAKENNLIIVYGASDDLCEFAGAIDDEFDCYNGGEIECENLPSTIEAIWDEKDGEPLWSYKTDMPHAAFNLYDGNELYCVGMVIDLSEINKLSTTLMSAKQAYEATQKNVKAKDERVFNAVQAKIEDAINDGRFDISEDGILPVNVRKKLENLGYKVNFGSQYGDPYYSVSRKDI